VAIASSLLLPFQEIEDEFEKQNEIEIDLISGASGSLTTQILNGAPYDLFISADKAFPARLFTEGLTLKEPNELFSGQVYLWSKHEIKNDVSAFLQSSNYRRIAIANPELAPYGKASKDWLIHFGIWTHIEPKLVFGNAISQINHYITTNVMDLAFSSNSAAYSDQLKNRGYWVKINDAALVPYFSVVIKSTNEPELANQFIDYLSGEKVGKVLSSYGFIKD
jgi:molybdate transport system substrate-binding protein